MLSKVFPIELKRLITGEFADIIVEFVELDHELLVSQP
jgi:hypothetical protein